MTSEFWKMTFQSHGCVLVLISNTVCSPGGIINLESTSLFGALLQPPRLAWIFSPAGVNSHFFTFSTDLWIISVHRWLVYNGWISNLDQLLPQQVLTWNWERTNLMKERTEESLISLQHLFAEQTFQLWLVDCSVTFYMLLNVLILF